MTYKIRKERKVAQPLPLPEALPGRGTETWEIREAGTGEAHCKFVEGEGGVIAVPLHNDKCEKCGSNHAAAARLHELAHAAISPDLNKVRNSFKSSGEKYEVSNQAIVIAEEMRAEYFAYRAARKQDTHREYDLTCMPALSADLEQMILDTDLRDVAIDTLAAAGGIQALGNALHQISNKITDAVNAGDKQTEERLRTIHDAAWELHNHAYKIKNYAKDQYSQNSRSWTRQLHIGYAVDQFIDAVGESSVRLKQDLRNLKDGAQKAQKEQDDLAPMRQKWGQTSSNKSKELNRFLNQLQYDSFKKTVEFQEGRKKMSMTEADGGEKVEWGHMTIDTPRLTKALPGYKTGWKPRATAEGTVPTYMHRWPVDRAIFKSRRREHTGSVLIDVSGSMGLSQQELESIVTAAPAGIVAIYSGHGQMGNVLRIIGKDKKMLDFKRAYIEYENNPYEDYAHWTEDDWDYARPYAYGMGGQNYIDRPALEWLAKQPLPRIWVSDGQVVSTTHRYSAASWQDCERVIIPNRINRVETAEEAALALQGKLALWR